MSPRNKALYTSLSMATGVLLRYPSEYGPVVIDIAERELMDGYRDHGATAFYKGILGHDPSPLPTGPCPAMLGIREGVVRQDIEPKVGRGERRRQAARRKLGMKPL